MTALNEIQMQLCALHTVASKAQEMVQQVTKGCDTRKLDLVKQWLVGVNPHMPKTWQLSKDNEGRIYTHSQTLSKEVCSFLRTWISDQLPRVGGRLVLEGTIGPVATVKFTFTLIRHELEEDSFRGWFAFPSWADATTASHRSDTSFKMDWTDYRQKLKSSIHTTKKRLEQLRGELQATENRLEENQQRLDACYQAKDVEHELDR